MLPELTPDSFIDVRKPLDLASWLPRQVYVDPAVYAQEIQKIWKREWLFAAHVSAVPSPGDYTTLALVGQPLVIMRGTDGIIRGFYNVCRHRGMAVASGCGHADVIACPYHGWKFDTLGQLIEAPMMDKTTGFDISTIKLRAIRTEVFHGMIFVNFDDDARALAPRIADLGDILAPWRIETLKPVFHDEYTGDFNWKVMSENANEGYHIIAAHRDSAQDISPAELSYSTDAENGRAWFDLHTPYVENVPASDVPEIPDVPDWSRRGMSFFTFYPNFLISLTPDHVSIYVTHPEGPGRTRFTWVTYVPQATTMVPGFAAFIDRMGAWFKQINREDELVCNAVQKGIASEGWMPPRYSHLEKPVWQFHNWYLDRLTGPVAAA